MARQLKNRVRAFFKIKPCVRSLARDLDEIFANAFTRRFDGAMPPIGRLKDEHCRSLFCQRLGDRSGRVAADFLIGYKKHSYRARQGAVPLLQTGDRVQH